MRRQIYIWGSLLFAAIAIWYLWPKPLPVQARVGANFPGKPIEEKSLSSSAPSTAPSTEIARPVARTGHEFPPRVPPFRPGRPPAPKINPSFHMEDFVQEKALQFNGRTMRLTKTVAVPDPRGEIDATKVIARMNGFAIVPNPDAAAAEMDQPILFDSSRPVVVNPANGRPEIISGTLVVKVKGAHAAERVAARNGLRLLSFDEALSLAYMRVPDGFPIVAGVAQIQRDPEVRGVEVEMLHGEVRAQ